MLELFCVIVLFISSIKEKKMKSDPENVNNQIVTFQYKSPKLKKYGSMKDFTLSNAGSGGDASGRAGGRASGGQTTGADSPVTDTSLFNGDLGPLTPLIDDTTFDFPNPINDGRPGAD